MASKRVHLRIEGRVQGVWFRESAKQQASRLGLTGWVKNLSDGAVEAVAEGDETPVSAFVEWSHRGPPSARVDSVRVQVGPATGEYTSFYVER